MITFKENGNRSIFGLTSLTTFLSVSVFLQKAQVLEIGQTFVIGSLKKSCVGCGDGYKVVLGPALAHGYNIVNMQIHQLKSEEISLICTKYRNRNMCCEILLSTRFPCSYFLCLFLNNFLIRSSLGMRVCFAA